MIRDPNLLQQFGIPRAVENPRSDAGGGGAESNSAGGNGRPASSGASETPAASSPPASFPTLASVAHLGAVGTGARFEPALYMYHGKYL